MSCGKCSVCSCSTPTSPSQERERVLATLLESGFSQTQHPALGATGYLKKLKVRAMPYLLEHAVPFNEMSEEDTAELEYCPETGQVALSVHAANYFEDPVTALSEEGKGLLRDAGVTL